MPDDVPLRVHLATMLMRAGLRDEAIRQVGAVLQRDPGNAAALALLAGPGPAGPPAPTPDPAGPRLPDPAPQAGPATGDHGRLTRGRPLSGTRFDAELVALRVAHHRVARIPADHAGSQPLQPRHLGGDRPWGAQVEMYPVLGRLGLGNPGEPDVRAAPARGLDERLLRAGVLIHIRPQGSRPEPGQRECVGGVEGDGLDHARHVRTLTGPARSGTPVFAWCPAVGLDGALVLGCAGRTVSQTARAGNCRQAAG